ncbi:MAG: hypothetical protein OXH72_06925 [Caldilineaceae bacterium]|nr:hypothetical protein [Caldilineaceae bacterium]
MTLLVGILCTDGVVIGSDSAATLGSGVLQTPVQKVYVVSDSILVASAGKVGLGQRFRQEVAQAANDDQFRALELVDQGVSLSERGLQNFKRTSSEVRSASALVAISNGTDPGSVGLIEFSSNGFSPCVIREGVRFTAAGSGDKVAGPLLALVRHAFWADSQPSVTDGVFAAAFVLNLATRIVPRGVGGPVQLGIMQWSDASSRGQLVQNAASSDSNFTVRLLDSEEIKEHIGVADGAIDHLSQYVYGKAGGPVAKIPDYPVGMRD